MNLRRRLALILSAVVTVVVVLTLALNFYITNSILRDSVDQQLRDEATAFTNNPVISFGRQPNRGEPARADRDDRSDRENAFAPGRFDAGGPGADAFRDRIGGFQLIDTDGTTFGSEIPIDGDLINRVRETGNDELSDQTDAQGARVRVLTRSLGNGLVVQVADNVVSLDSGFSSLRRGLFVIGLAGVVTAGVIGWFVAERFTKPIRTVTDAAAHLAKQQDLPSRIEVNRDDEIGALAASFNQMLAALQVSREQQTRLVADASHELRTPLTSLRMKIDFLESQPDLPAETRTPIVAGAAVELESLGELVTELVDLASNSPLEEMPIQLGLGELVEDAVARARLSTGRTIEVETSDTQVTGRPKMIRRAILNLVDNANKYSPHDRPIAVVEVGGRIEVRDHGPGIASEDQPYAFDRFFRASTARTKPGSGIGLAIVKRAAEVHDGEVWVKDADGGGAVVGFSVATENRPATADS